MKQRKPLNRAQRRKSELQKGVELLVRREREAAYTLGKRDGMIVEHERCMQYVHPDDSNSVDLDRLKVGTQPYVRVEDPPRNRRFDAHPEGFGVQSHTFRSEPLCRQLPNGTVVRWYMWHMVD